MEIEKAKKLILVGASGRVGTLVRAAWRVAPPSEFEVLAQYRRSPAKTGPGDIIGDPLIEPFPYDERSVDSQSVMVILAGATPGSAVPLHFNTEIALGCLRAARKLGIRRVLVSSSSAVYGPGIGHPFRESDQPEGENDYGASKRAMETAVHAAAGDIDVCCLRIGNVLGADALLLAARTASQENPLMLDQFASGSGPVRSYIDPMTLAAVLASLANHQGHLPKTLNVAAPYPVAMEDIADAANISWRWRTANQGATERIVLDCSMLESIYQFSALDHEPSSMLARLDEVTNAI